MRFRLDVDGEIREIEVERKAGRFAVRVDGATYPLRLRSTRDGTEVRIGSSRYRVRLRGNEAVLDDGVHRIRIAEVSEDIPARREGSRIGSRALVEVRPAMPGRVVRIAVTPGARVRRGQTLIVLEAMKMQNEIPSPGDGVVRAVGVREGDTVTADRVVASVELRAPAAS